MVGDATLRLTLVPGATALIADFPFYPLDVPLPENLPNTCADVDRALMLATVLLAAGILLLIVTRRRRLNAADH